MTKIAPNSLVGMVIDVYVQDYGQKFNLPLRYVIRGHYVPTNREEQTAIAKAYTELPVLDDNPDTFLAYSQLVLEIKAQYDFAVSCGFKFDPWLWEGQPYANSEEMSVDVRYHRHLWYFTGGEEHPYLKENNLLLRAIHDLFGHAAEGFQFGPCGEVNAWLHHSMMFSPLAQCALTTETHGQNSYTNFGPYSHIPANGRLFADQKVALLPERFCDWRKWLA